MLLLDSPLSLVRCQLRGKRNLVSHSGSPKATDKKDGKLDENPYSRDERKFSLYANSRTILLDLQPQCTENQRD